MIAGLTQADAPNADFSGLNQLQSLHADMPVLADDDVIVHGYPERAGDVDDRLCHVDIRLRGRRIARGVVMHQQDRGRG